MTISQLRCRVNALKHRFARELAIIQARRVAEAVADHWQRSNPPDTPQVIRRFTDARIRSNSYGNLAEYLDESRRKDEIPYPDVMVCNLLRYAWNHRYDELFRWDLPPQEPRHDCPNLPAWV
ncbi:MAG: hypothetical protein F4W95_15230 [Chloroflexi bacterium]|nr:hypothetical protein [Chloroflexota bacterium]MYD49809.1 hypothetical protein [Chloroflexota bacterium]